MMLPTLDLAPGETWPSLPDDWTDWTLDDGRLDWQALAACAQTDPEPFFPQKGGTPKPAKRMCAACPVRAQCLEWAMGNKQQHGIFGGMTARERQNLRESPAAVPPATGPPKVCTRCGVEKPRSEFYRQRRYVPGGGNEVSPRCKTCVKQLRAEAKRARDAA